jgi:hypothetical protein
MATGTYTLLDLATRSGVGVQSLIEGVLTYAPEMQVVPTFPKAGITYTTLTRTALPSGDFRHVGGGVALQKSEWKRETGSMALFEAQLAIAEDIVIAAMAENPDLIVGDLLSDEGMATLRGSVIKICSQFWYGTKISSAGFAGLSTQVDTAANEVNAGGSAGADSSSAYLVYLDDNVVNPQGVHFLLGNSGRMAMSPEWIKQRVPLASDTTKFYMAFVNNFLSYLGLVVERPQAVYRAKNITDAFPFTDGVAAQVLRKVPLALRADKSKFRWFMNGSALYTLQASRATVTVATGGDKGVGKGGVFPDVPESCQGITIVPTDSLITTERAGLKP